MSHTAEPATARRSPQKGEIWTLRTSDYRLLIRSVGPTEVEGYLLNGENRTDSWPKDELGEFVSSNLTAMHLPDGIDDGVCLLGGVNE